MASVSSPASRYVVRPQSSPAPVRNSAQQPYVNIISGGRLQQSSPALSRPAQQSAYYVAGGTNSPVRCLFVVFFSETVPAVLLGGCWYSSSGPSIAKMCYVLEVWNEISDSFSL